MVQFVIVLLEVEEVDRVYKIIYYFLFEHIKSRVNREYQVFKTQRYNSVSTLLKRTKENTFVWNCS